MVALDETASLWAIGILALLLGIALGAMVTYSLVARSSRTHKLQRELTQLSDRFADYRDQVGQHFMHTSDLVKEMTRSYRAVYEHLATGAHHLCAEDPETPALGHPDPKIPIRWFYISRSFARLKRIWPPPRPRCRPRN